MLSQACGQTPRTADINYSRYS